MLLINDMLENVYGNILEDTTFQVVEEHTNIIMFEGEKDFLPHIYKSEYVKYQTTGKKPKFIIRNRDM